MSKYEKHECLYQQEGARIEKSRMYFHEKCTWQLVLEREATEEDLEETGYLENVGDSIWSVVAEINHCPYCGVQLNTTKDENKEFCLFDSTDWSVRCL